MNKRQAQLQKLLEELLPDNVESLVKDLFDSAVATSKDARGRAHLDRARLEALGREAWESMDRAKIERWAREAIRNLDTDKLEKWARSSLSATDSDKLKRLLRDKLGNLDKDKLEALLAEGMRHIDRRKLEDKVRDRIRSLDLDKIKAVAQARLTDLDPKKIEDFVNARIDSRVESVLQNRLDALNTDELEKMLATKRAALKRKGRGRKAIKGEASVVVETEKAGKNPIAALVGTLGRVAFFGAAGWIAYSHLFLEHQVPLPKAIAAELLTLVYRPSGPINIYQDRGGSGETGSRPLVLIHSINAAASSYEMRPIFQHFRGKRPVFALDLPGFGFSARAKIEYTPDIYVNAILTLLSGIGGEPADVVALSLSSEFAAEAARRRPELFHTLTLISPSGMSEHGSEHSSQGVGVSGLGGIAYPLLSFRLWSRPFYDLLTTRRSIAYYLQKSFVGQIPDGMIDYAIATSHQPGAEHAPLYFVAGRLFSAHALDRIYRQVTTPTLVLYDEDPYVKFDALPDLLATNPAFQAKRISPTLGLPHWEKPEETIQALESFWQSVKEPVA